ncbi:hypothetical protein CYMTET_38843 [Cymbomonas tetramitiformis]|uniref:Uncharacterized protein n=1 Tax=Cymbomonas tetramitiformis TaxID=36881 RepID=A0AAE0CCR3_9CHLO|nr:hypothetical protein CYMTET_38843 [Cymbomonas tetramitiformis]
MSAWPPAPPPAAHAQALQALDPPPLDDTAQHGAAATTVRFSAGGDLHNEDYPLDDVPPDATPPAFLAIDEEEDTWPAYRSHLNKDSN